jgi:hypothetical protein
MQFMRASLPEKYERLLHPRIDFHCSEYDEHWLVGETTASIFIFLREGGGDLLHGNLKTDIK